MRCPRGRDRSASDRTKPARGDACAAGPDRTAWDGAGCSGCLEAARARAGTRAEARGAESGSRLESFDDRQLLTAPADVSSVRQARLATVGGGDAPRLSPACRQLRCRPQARSLPRTPRRTPMALDDDAALLLMARAVLGGPTDASRTSHQIAMTVGEHCGADTQQGKGEAAVAQARADHPRRRGRHRRRRRARRQHALRPGPGPRRSRPQGVRPGARSGRRRRSVRASRWNAPALHAARHAGLRSARGTPILAAPCASTRAPSTSP